MGLPLNQVLLGDCLEVLKTLPDNSIDAVVCDPPYGLGTRQPSREDILKYLHGARLDTSGDFMGKDWEIPPIAVWAECLRVLKPGGQLLSFAGTRTFDMVGAGIREAGFEDHNTVASMFGPCLAWIYGAGFPKSLDIAKAIDKAGRGPEEAKKWQGWGTALKPSWEPVLCFRKPIGRPVVRAVSENRLNIEGPSAGLDVGRWPTNIALAHVPECVQLPDGSWTCDEGCPIQVLNGRSGPRLVSSPTSDEVETLLVDSSPDAPFFYTAKASRADRNDGLDAGEKGTYVPGVFSLRDDVDEMQFQEILEAFKSQGSEDFSDRESFPPVADKLVPNSVRKYFRQARKGERGNAHVTVKPIALMRWLVRLVCPKGGVVLDPYTGSGTTLVAAAEEGMDFVGIEIDPAYHTTASKRAGSVAARRFAAEDETSLYNLAFGE